MQLPKCFYWTEQLVHFVHTVVDCIYIYIFFFVVVKTLQTLSPDVSDKQPGHWMTHTHAQCALGMCVFIPSEIMFAFQGHALDVCSSERVSVWSVWRWWSAAPHRPTCLPVARHFIQLTCELPCQDIKQPCTCVCDHSGVWRLSFSERHHISIAGLFPCNPATQQWTSVFHSLSLIILLVIIIVFLLFFLSLSFPFSLPLSQKMQ